MDRYEEIMQAVCQDDADRTIYGPLAHRAVLLEEKLAQLEALPHIVVHPTDPTKQKTTPAHKQYKELLQQYSNIVKILGRVTGADGDTGESPLRTWAKGRMAADAD
jgi:hypothetical protein